MRIDFYTKAVLTIIAGALVWLCVAATPLGTPVTAQGTPALTHVVIGGWVDASGTQHRLPVPNTAIASLPVASHAPMTTAGPTTAPPAQAPAPPTANRPANWNTMTAADQTQWLACQQDPANCGTTASASGATAGRTTAKPAPAQQQTRVQCAATTQRGTRCSRMAEPGGQFCWQHKGL
jgi:hypothetical protein